MPEASRAALPPVYFAYVIMDADYTVLLVDDNETFLHHATRFIERTPRLQVIDTARRIRDGLASAKRLRPDIILLDLSMPDGGGLEAISDFHEAAPGARIIILTMQDAPTYRDVALRHGADDFVSKSDMVSDLVKVMLSRR